MDIRNNIWLVEKQFLTDGKTQIRNVDLFLYGAQSKAYYQF